MRYLSLHTHDFDELALGFRNWDARFRQISRGSFNGELQVVQAGGIQVVRVRANQVIQAQGVQREKRYLFTPATPQNAGSNWKGQHLEPGQIRVLHPGELMDHFTAHGFEILIVHADPEYLGQAAEVLYGVNLDDALADEFALTAEPTSRERLVASLRQCFPGPGGNHPRSLPLNENQVEQTLTRLLLETLLGAFPRFCLPDRSTNRQRLARQVEEYLENRLREPVTTRELCEEFDVSQRTLEYCFRDHVGLSPMAYFKVKRLNAVRQALKGANPDVPLHEVAQDWGFAHTGAFAADYRRQFGELPSRTRQKSSSG